MLDANEIAKITRNNKKIETAAKIFLSNLEEKIYKDALNGHFSTTISHNLDNSVLNIVIKKLQALKYKVSQYDAYCHKDCFGYEYSESAKLKISWEQ